MTDDQPDVDGETGATGETETEETESTERTVIRSGREFEREYRLSAAAAGEFLVDLGERLQSGDELTITDEEWELPFGFGEPVELEVDYDGVDDPELEIEVELPGRSDDTGPSVE
ncbi:amphi-Trp domain-containing protein [Halobaculum sp. MBLA0143]|uniref:amphi-Trp domain-containing protein n=1 Tax=Halobaculum sp. MBLA0143 TaxID=3079933 RepID=UPI003526346D